MPVVNREKEREIVTRALDRGWSEDQIKQAVTKFRSQASPVSAPTTQEQPAEKTGFLSSVAESAKDRFGDITESFKRTINAPGEEREQSPISTSFQTVGSLAGLGFDVVGAGVESAVRALTPDDVGRSVEKRLEIS